MYPIIFTVDHFHFGTYGLLVSFGILLSFMFIKHSCNRFGMSYKKIFNLSFLVLISGIVCSKCFLLVNDIVAGMQFKDIAIVNYIRSGGIIHGGVIGATLTLFLLTKYYRLSLALCLDLFAPAVAFGEAIGRLGCFFAGCCYGTTSKLHWSVTFRDIDAFLISGTPIGIPLHPVQLYSFSISLLIFVTLLLVFNNRNFSGQVGGLYFIFEGSSRLIIETWRGDLSRQFLFGIPWLSMGRCTGLLLLLFGLFIFVWFYIHKRKIEIC